MAKRRHQIIVFCYHIFELCFIKENYIKIKIYFVSTGHILQSISKTYYQQYFHLLNKGRVYFSIFFWRVHIPIVRDLHSETKDFRFVFSSSYVHWWALSSNLWLMSFCLWNGWSWWRDVKEIASPSSCCPENCECFWKKPSRKKCRFWSTY